jgi:hypothetical protein
MNRLFHFLAWATLAGLVGWAALAALALGLASGWPALHWPQIEVNGIAWAVPWDDLDPTRWPLACIVLGSLALLLVLPVAVLLPLLVAAAVVPTVLLLVLAVVAVVAVAACSPLLLLGAAAWLIWRSRRRAGAARAAGIGAAR